MSARLLHAAGTLIGIGMGGFVDGIVFHQILQVHNMLSARIPVNSLANAEVNMVWDGLFHALTWISTAAGIYLLWKAGLQRSAQWSGQALLGAALFGWGLFNFVEGLIDHHVLHLHHVIERLGQSVYDYAFLASGLALMLTGRTMMRRSRPKILP